ncbi:MAG: NAD(P)-dependent oxidoreductase [Acidimicrobiales bacterium]
MKLLLTGASGFFGSNLVDLLLQPSTSAAAEDPNRAGTRGPRVERHRPPFEMHLVHRSDRSAASPTGRPDGPRVVDHRCDLFDERATSALVEQVKPSHLCHLAWLGPETEDRYRSPENRRWVDASKHLFEAFAEHGGRRLVHLGSCIEYGNTATGVRVETQPLDPDTPYGEAKAELSTHVLAMGSALSTAVARPFFSYGPHEQPDRLVSSLILALLRDREIDLTEGRQRRDYLHAGDVVAALWALLRSEATGPFNIGSGEAVEVRSIAEHLGRITGRATLLNFGARPEGADTAAEIVADIGRITSATEWKPTIELGPGLEETTAWWAQRVGETPQPGGDDQ